MIISLVGFRGTGKSTIARHLADRLECDWVDADVEIVRSAQKSIAEIFAEEGEKRFRDLESNIVRQLMSLDQPKVIAWGGGAVIREQNRDWIRKSNHCIWLTASAETLFDRTENDAHSAANRPALSNLDPLQEIKTQLSRRHDWYSSVSTFECNTEGQTVEQIASLILAHIAQQQA